MVKLHPLGGMFAMYTAVWPRLSQVVHCCSCLPHTSYDRCCTMANTVITEGVYTPVGTCGDVIICPAHSTFVMTFLINYEGVIINHI